jgi:hypothetical protein
MNFFLDLVLLQGKLTLGEFFQHWSNNKYIVNSVLYGEMYTPLFFSLTSLEFHFSANLNPFGSIKIPPTFKSAFSISPNLLLVYIIRNFNCYQKTEFGRTACGASTSIAFFKLTICTS